MRLSPAANVDDELYGFRCGTDAKMRVVFVTNICPHYRVRTFETLSAYCSVHYYFFSAGKEWYWQRQHGTRIGNFKYEYLRGVRIGGTRITPTLVWKLLTEPCDAFIKCINGRFALPVTYFIARLRNKPFVLWTGVWMTLQTPFHRLVFPLTRHIYRNADAIVTYGQHVKGYLVSQGVAEHKIFVAAHAVDNAQYSGVVAETQVVQLRHRLGISQGQRVVLYLGRLEPSKGLTYLLEAFQTLVSDDAVLLFAGDGTDRERLRGWATELGMGDRIRFSNYVPTDETPAYYALAYVLVLPSITTNNFKEPWGLVVNEAMNQGCPVIASDAVGAAAGGLVQDGINGIVVPERDSHTLRSALQRLFDQPDLRERMSDNSRMIVSQWDNERMVLGFRRALDFVAGRIESPANAASTLHHQSAAK
jgi:glycosyltransferase involved in cell wall biosynthesis